MSIRFRPPSRQHARSSSGQTRVEGFGEWWAAIAAIALASAVVLALSGASRGPANAVTVAPTVAAIPTTTEDPGPKLFAALDPAIRSLKEVESAFVSLCREPVLVALELEPDCETGVITLEDKLFGEFGDAQLQPESQEDVVAAMTTYLTRLQALPQIWDRLEAIEIRGHSDPRAFRNPYSTNLVGSQQRALGVLLFLVGPNGLTEAKSDTLKRLATVSGAAYSRPPASCPEQTRSCYADWRRVEIRPVLSESLRRGDWARTVEGVREASAGMRSEVPPR